MKYHICMFTVSFMLIIDHMGMLVNTNISSFFLSVLYKIKTIEIQRGVTLMNGRNCNTQYGGIVPPSK